MSQPVKLSDALVLEARIAAEAQERSIAGQVEYWAKLGNRIERLFDGRQIEALRKTTEAPTVGQLLEVVDTPKGREMFQAFLESEPYPHYRAHPDANGYLIRTEENGKETIGRFVNRQFVARKLVRTLRRAVK
jgi:ParD-like antitoxin of type II bacterial toxin-antitoxin system